MLASLTITKLKNEVDEWYLLVGQTLPDLTISLDSVLYVFKYGNSGKICKKPVTQWALAI
jgi:hypothetical protein